MNMENRSTWAADSGERVLLAEPADHCEEVFAIRQQLWERAQRLYAIGELHSAAELFSELAAGSHPHQAEGGVEAIRG